MNSWSSRLSLPITGIQHPETPAQVFYHYFSTEFTGIAAGPSLEEWEISFKFQIVKNLLKKQSIISLPRGKEKNLSLKKKWTALKTYIIVTLHRLNKLYLGKYMYYLHICGNSNHENKRPWIWKRARRDIGEVWEGQREWKKCCNYIIIKRNNGKKK